MWYRVQQFWQAVFSKPLTIEEWDEVKAVLEPSEVCLFENFARSDQTHGLRVLKNLRANSFWQPALLKAALLHDIGKTKISLSIWERVIVVLGLKFFPEQSARWGEGEAVGWQRPFVVKAHHPEWGAQMAAAAGSDPMTVSLIRRHQEKLGSEDLTEEDRLLRALQFADDRS